MNQNLTLNTSLSALIKRADGSHRNIADLSTGSLSINVATRKLNANLPFLQRVWAKLRATNAIPAALTFGAFLHAINSGDASPVLMGLVTTAGVNYMAADFLAASSARINAFNYHDCGEGDTSAATSDTALEDPFGGSRVAGTQSNPSSNVYQSVATISFSGTFSVTEWGLFSASSSGTLWDRRTFSSIGVNSGDSIAFTYALTIPAGGE